MEVKELTDGGAKTITIDNAVAAYGTCMKMSFHPKLHTERLTQKQISNRLKE